MKTNMNTCTRVESKTNLLTWMLAAGTALVLVACGQSNNGSSTTAAATYSMIGGQCYNNLNQIVATTFCTNSAGYYMNNGVCYSSAGQVVVNTFCTSQAYYMNNGSCIASATNLPAPSPTYCSTAITTGTTVPTMINGICYSGGAQVVGTVCTSSAYYINNGTCVQGATGAAVAGTLCGLTTTTTTTPIYSICDGLYYMSPAGGTVYQCFGGAYYYEPGYCAGYTLYSTSNPTQPIYCQ